MGGQHLDQVAAAARSERQAVLHARGDLQVSRRTRHDCAAAAAAECKIRRPARACRAWVAYGEPSVLTLPDTLDPPARLAQQRGDLAIATAAVLPGNIGGETPRVVTTARDLGLRRAMLPERHTGATLGD